MTQPHLPWKPSKNFCQTKTYLLFYVWYCSEHQRAALTSHTPDLNTKLLSHHHTRCINAFPRQNINSSEIMRGLFIIALFAVLALSSVSLDIDSSFSMDMLGRCGVVVGVELYLRGGDGFSWMILSIHRRRRLWNYHHNPRSLCKSMFDLTEVDHWDLSSSSTQTCYLSIIPLKA